MTSRFLMCQPEYFDVSYVINPWMTDNVNRVTRSQAKTQWLTLHGKMKNAARVELIDPEPGLPDMPFTANAGLVVGHTAIVSNFLHPERQSEERHFERWFSQQGFDVLRLARAVPFEGAGDALLDRERGCIWMGYGHRSAYEAGALVQSMLGLEVIPLELCDPRFYHLDTCFCPLARGYVMYYANAFSPASQTVLRGRIPWAQTILVGEDDALEFACNSVNIGDQVILNRASERLVGELARAGFQTQQSPLSEFLRAGGASKCLTLRLEETM